MPHEIRSLRLALSFRLPSQRTKQPPTQETADGSSAPLPLPVDQAVRMSRDHTLVE